MDDETKKCVLDGFRELLEAGMVPNSLFGLAMREDEPTTPVEYRAYQFIGETAEDQKAIDAIRNRSDVDELLSKAEDALCRVLRLYRIEVQADRIARDYTARCGKPQP
jgi:hypothetical protein